MVLPKVSATISRGERGEPVLEEERHEVTDEGRMRLRSEDEVEGEMKPLLLAAFGTVSDAGRAALEYMLPGWSSGMVGEPE
jgi:hypothetical protein